MKRTRLEFLEQWLKKPDRKPLIIRGARQVGKTWLVKHFAQIHGLILIDVNLEKRPELTQLLTSNDPKQTVLNLGASLKLNINPEKSLLFFDEIQAAPEILAKLRWFAEDMPELPVIAAGSLLEFALENFAFSMPVGRISYLYLEPLSFEEFLLATGYEQLAQYIRNYSWKISIPQAIHDQLIMLFKEYILIGGMPQAVENWVTYRTLQEVNLIHHDILGTYRDDFNKYAGKLSIERLDEVMLAVPKYLGEKFVYTRVNRSIPMNSIKQSFDLLAKARVCHKVMGTYANGIPLGAEINDKFMKAIFLDVGLCSASLGLSLDQLTTVNEIALINNGGIAEQIVGQLLRTINQPYIEPSLYYWHREEKGSNAEIDYVIQHQNQVVPIEVKAGSTGSLKSLHFFMGLKQFPYAVRFNSEPPSTVDVSVKDHHGKIIEYKLYSLPFYLISELHRLLTEKN